MYSDVVLLREYVPFFMRFFAYLELLAFVFFFALSCEGTLCGLFEDYLLMVVCDSLIDIPWELRGMEQSIGWEDALFIDVIQNLIIILLLCLIYIGRECLPTNLRAVLGQFAEKYFFAIGAEWLSSRRSCFCGVWTLPRLKWRTTIRGGRWDSSGRAARWRRDFLGFCFCHSNRE